MSAYYGNKAFLTIGKLVVKTKPDLAAELLQFHTHQDNLQDRNLINPIFKKFCKLQDAQEEATRDIQDKRHRHLRRIFIGVILKLYCRQVFDHPPNQPVLPYNIVKPIHLCLNTCRSGISQTIRQVLSDYRNYEDFRDEVDQLSEQLKSIQNGKA